MMKWIILTFLFILSSCVPTAKNYPLPVVTDETPPVVSVAQTNTVWENGTSTSITAYLNKISSKPVTIPINFYGTATATIDYSIPSTSITIPAGSLTGSLSISMINDVVTEGTETVIAVFKTPTNATLSLTNFSHTLSILDDETIAPLPNVHFSAASYSITELNIPHINTSAITVILNTPAQYDIFVPISVSPSSTATNNVDYYFGQTYVQIPAGSTTVNYPINILGDTIYEGLTAETVAISMGTPVGANLLGQTSTTVNITEDDTAPTLSFSTPLTPTISEGASSVNVTVQLSAASATPITFKIVANQNTASTGTDYNFNNDNVTLTIPAYTTSYTTSVNIMEDNLFESSTPEDFSLTLSSLDVSVSAPFSVMTISISDNESTPTVTFNNSGITISESSSTVTVNLTASVPSQSSYVVTFTTTSSTATNGTDYTTTTPSSVTMPANATTVSMTYTLQDDAWGESAETIVYAISASANYIIGSIGTNTTTIVDNDPIPTINFNITSFVTAESTASVTVALSLSNPSGSIVSGTVTATGGTATGSGTDYTLTGGTYSFAIGTTSAPSTPLSITINNDPNDEVNETVILNISTATNAVIGTNNTYILTITDDDVTPTVNITPVTATYSEAVGTITVTATLSPAVASGLDITVPYSLSGTATRSATGDYDISGTYGTLTIPAGSLSASETITINDDTIYETATAETIIWSASSPTNGIMGTGSSSTWSITDNDTLPTVSFASSTSSATESSTTQVYTASLSNPSSQTITVPITVGGTATNATDFTYSPGSVVFPGCDETPCTTTASVNVPIIDDTSSENNETVILNLGAPIAGVVAAGATLAHTLTINDEDLVVSFSTSAVTVNETSSGTLVLQLASPHTIPVGETLDVPITITGTATSGTDYTAFPTTTVTFTSASTSQNVVVPTLDDNLNENAETVIITIGTPVYSGATYEGVIGSVSAGTVTINSSDPVTSLSLGANHTCVTINVTGNDTVKCWGDNSMMQVANATVTNNIGDTVNEMGSNLAALSPTTSYTQVAAGKNHSCALDGSTVKCWGDDSYGQVGDGAPTGPFSTPQTVSGVGLVTQIAVGDNHSCALMSTGGVKCWGDNSYGQIGMDTPSGSSVNVATTVDIGTQVVAISAGANHTCALKSGPYRVFCWGENSYGQLGQDNTDSIGDNNGEMTTLTSDPIAFVSGFTPNQISMGRSHSCAVSSTGAALCWGKNLYGQLGVDNVNAYGSSATYSMSGLTGINTGASSFTRVSAGGDSTCLITSGNLLQCFGANTYGQLGIESIASVGQNSGDMIAIDTTDLGSGLYATNVSLGLNHTCAILNNGQIKCWGLNSFGQLGLENTTTKGDNSGEMGSNLSSPSF